MDASGPDPVARKREIVNLAMVPAVAEPALRGATYYVSKQPRDPAQPTVWLTVMASAASEAAIRAAVEPRLTAFTVVDYCVAPDDPILKPEYAWWRRGVRAVTDVALDLHRGSDAEFLAHRGFLLHIEGRLQVAATPHPDLRAPVPSQRRVQGALRGFGKGRRVLAGLLCVADGGRPLQPRPLALQHHGRVSRMAFVAAKTPKKWQDH